MQSSPPPLTSTMTDTCKWIDMFETLCARYHCRSVESLANVTKRRYNDRGCCSDYDDVLFIGGPSGKWLAEITSITLTKTSTSNSASGGASSSMIRVAESSEAAVRKVINYYERKEMQCTSSSCVDYEIVLDWFAFRSTGVVSSLTFVTKNDYGATTSTELADVVEKEERQCILRVDRNNGIITLLLLANTTNVQELSPISISCNAHIERCLRPFLFIFACELAIRKVEYDNLNLYQDAFSPASCWLTKAREMHKRTKWIRVTRYGDEDAEIRDRIICQRTNATGIRLLWRDGRVFHASAANSSLFTHKLAHLLPQSAVIDLSVMHRDIKHDERSVLSLCDFDVLFRRCENSFVSSWLSTGGGYDDDATTNVVNSVRAYELAAINGSSDRDQVRRRIDGRILSVYESRYFVNANNELISRRFMRLS